MAKDLDESYQNVAPSPKGVGADSQNCWASKRGYSDETWAGCVKDETHGRMADVKRGKVRILSDASIHMPKRYAGLGEC